jgi:hypothetical protein
MHGPIIRKQRILSAVSSGRRMFREHLSTATNDKLRRFVDLVALFTTELGSKLTTSQNITVRKIASLQVLAEDLEMGIVKGTAAAKDRAEYLRINTQQTRLMKGMGLSNVNAAADDDGDDIDPLAYAERRRSGSTRLHRERLKNVLDEDEED